MLLAVGVQSRPPPNFRFEGHLQRSRTLATRFVPSTFGSSVSVAPSFNASSRRALMGSIAMICDAPLMRAPWTALRPTGPQPSTTTSAAGSIGATPNVVPSPQAPTQPSIDSSTADTVLTIGTGMQYHSYGIISSAKPPSLLC